MVLLVNWTGCGLPPRVLGVLDFPAFTLNEHWDKFLSGECDVRIRPYSVSRLNGEYT